MIQPTKNKRINEVLVAEGIQEHWRNNPAEFSKTILNTNLYAIQRDIMNSVRDNRNTAVYGGNGLGKSHVMAITALWYAVSHHPCKVLTFATNKLQNKHVVWSAINNLYNNASINLGGSITDGRISFSDSAYILGVSFGEKQESFAGHHSERVLVCVDEGSSLDEKTLSSIRSLLTTEGSRLLVVGNPLFASGVFYKMCHSTTFSKIHVTHKDVKGLVSTDFVKEIEEEYGRDSDEYRSRVEGLFPQDTGSASYISADTIRACLNRTEPLAVPEKRSTGALNRVLYGTRLGVDVARFGENKSVITERIGLHARVIKTYDKNSSTELEGYIAYLIDEVYHGDVLCFVDEGGVGGALIDNLQDNHIISDKIIPVNFGKKADNENRYASQRAELLDTAKKWMEYGCLRDEEMMEAMQWEYSYDKTGRLSTIKHDKNSSTDYFDSFLTTFASHSVVPDWLKPNRKINTFQIYE